MKAIIKTKEEINKIRRSSQLAASCLDYIERFVKAGTTTGALNDLIAAYVTDHGAISAPLNYVPPRCDLPPFPKETCISLNEVICHGIPGDRVLVDGDILNIDVTTILSGYYGDTSRMFTVGNTSTKAKALVEVAKNALMVGIHQVWPGNDLSRIGYEITRYAEGLGFGVVHQFTGHGVGLKFHEPPCVPHFVLRVGNSDKLIPGQIFTIEPMINEGSGVAVMGEDQWTASTTDGKLSAQWEHTILVTNTGFEILTEV